VAGIDNLFYAWRSEDDKQQGVVIKLVFPVNVRVKSVVLWGQKQTAECDVKVNKATVRLFADAAATAQVGGDFPVSAVAATGTAVDVSAGGNGQVARVVSVTLDDVSGKLNGYAVSSLGEIEVIARGE
jgi:hypothetical protein